MKCMELLADTAGLGITTNITHLNGVCCGEGVPGCHTTKLGALLIHPGGATLAGHGGTTGVDTLNFFGMDLARSVYRLVI